MTNHNFPESVAARANQEDPIIMYLIVRESLGMSIGKTAAQCAHASQMLLLRFMMLDKIANVLTEVKPDDSIKALQIFQVWLDSSFRKVVLRADDKQWDKIQKEIPWVDLVKVTDSGLTELVPGTDTVIGIWPMHKSKCPKIIKRLQVLK